MPKSRLPERWENYTNLGEVIQGTRLITFKVPLNEFLCRKYEDEKLWFTPDTLLELTEAKDIHLGLIIDLTFTTRYYNPEKFTSQGVQYEKIFVPGHEIPDDQIIDRFFTVIDQFLEDNEDNDKVIGVHCTHGVNRTGYVVCRYMIDRLGFKPDDAIEAYGKARGYPIERVNYLEDLKQRPKKSEAEDGNEVKTENYAVESNVNETENRAIKSRSDKPLARKLEPEEDLSENNKRRKTDHESYQNGDHEFNRMKSDRNLPNQTDQYGNQRRKRKFQSSSWDERTRQEGSYKFAFNDYQPYQQEGHQPFHPGDFGAYQQFGDSQPYKQEDCQPFYQGGFQPYPYGDSQPYQQDSYQRYYQEGWSNFECNDYHGYGRYPPRPRGRPYRSRGFNSKYSWRRPVSR